MKTTHCCDCIAQGHEIQLTNTKIDYKATAKVANQTHVFLVKDMPIQVCPKRQEQYFNNETDNAIQTALLDYLSSILSIETPKYVICFDTKDEYN